MTTGELADATIVFDLDGTLVDTAPDIVRALNETLALEGLPRVKLEAARTMVGQGARALIERAAARAGVSFRDERLDQLTETFVSFYRTDIARDSRAFPGVAAALEDLAASGAKFAVCTNKRTDLSHALLQALGMSDWFATIVGADAVADRKPHPDHYRAAVARAGGTVRRSVMIGDTIADIAAARGAGAPVAAVAFGYCDDGAEKLGADVVLRSFSEVAPACRRLLAARA
ncbi:MAG TPA: phosphoglycolate phosphatase [Vitreimonas sp.]|uniref:phosphoglycolate phosphatase n=1 Tax=Vitreimonas sp. TaxID=3069702 RepID=UPI002D564688|nr:phosphoglycolate phosphatase [Vitreimonas sp.]HYD86138.1 phosphoglycolate phosphatase [Vitreimonas sp.]